MTSEDIIPPPLFLCKWNLFCTVRIFTADSFYFSFKWKNLNCFQIEEAKPLFCCHYAANCFNCFCYFLVILIKRFRLQFRKLFKKCEVHVTWVIYLSVNIYFHPYLHKIALQALFLFSISNNWLKHNPFLWY